MSMLENIKVAYNIHDCPFTRSTFPGCVQWCGLGRYQTLVVPEHLQERVATCWMASRGSTRKIAWTDEKRFLECIRMMNLVATPQGKIPLYDFTDRQRYKFLIISEEA